MLVLNIKAFWYTKLLSTRNPSVVKHVPYSYSYELSRYNLYKNAK